MSRLNLLTSKEKSKLGIHENVFRRLPLLPVPNVRLVWLSPRARPSAGRLPPVGLDAPINLHHSDKTRLLHRLLVCFPNTRTPEGNLLSASIENFQIIDYKWDNKSQHNFLGSGAKKLAPLQITVQFIPMYECRVQHA